MQKPKLKTRKLNNSLRLTAFSFGALAGVTGIISGFSMLQQGTVKPDGLWVSSIGPAYSMYEHGTYEVLTLAPSFLISGILAIFVSSLALVWSLRYLDRRHGVMVMLILAAAQCLVGGGWVLDLGLLTALLASKLYSPLSWWRRRLREPFRGVLARLYPWSLVGYGGLSVMLLAASMMGMNSESVVALVAPIAAFMILPVPVMVFGAIARDVREE